MFILMRCRNVNNLTALSLLTLSLPEKVKDKSGFKIRRLQNTPNQLRISSSFRKTKSEHLIRLRSRVIPFKVGKSYHPLSGSMGL